MLLCVVRCALRVVCCFLFVVWFLRLLVDCSLFDACCLCSFNLLSVSCSLSAVCGVRCALFAACGVLCVMRCLLFVACWLLFGACGLLFVACGLL